MNTFTDIDQYIADFGFSPIHIAVLDLYNREDSGRPGLQELIDFVDDANNAPAGNDWAIWRRPEAKLSPLYAAIIETFRSASAGKPKTEKTILDIINQRDEKWGWPPFHWAAFTGRLEKMKILASKDSAKADIFMLSPMGRNSLHIAAESKRPDVLSHVLTLWEHSKEKLDINLADRWKETPLHVAASGSSACVKLLLDKGADPTARQENQQVPLHYLSLCPKTNERIKILDLLCSNPKVSFNARDDYGRTPLFELLDSPSCISKLISYGADLSVADGSGNSVFHSACIEHELDALKIFLQQTPDPEATTRLNKDGNTPLIEAFAHSSIKCVRLLLKRPDAGCIPGKDGWSAVHYAAKWGNEEILESVLTHPSFKRRQLTVGSSVQSSQDSGLFMESAVIYTALR